MSRNENGLDRVIRILLGLALMGGGVALGGTTGLVTGAVGLVPLLTGLLGFCPAYALFGIRTCPLQPRDAGD